mgnify:FL=1
MTEHIVYERQDGTDTIRRDEYHTDSEPLLTAYNMDNGDVVAKVQIPISRVVRIDSR